MSQWGAYGYAQKGVTYDKIVTHYFPGTKLDTTTVKSIRVLLVQTPSITISSTGPWKVKDGRLRRYDARREADAQPRAGVQASRRRPSCRRFAGPLIVHLARRRSCSRRPTAARSPSRPTASTCTLVNTVPLEQYLYAVVPSEMPKTLAGGGSEGAGRRGTVVRARAAQDGRAVRRLPRHAQPGLRRRRAPRRPTATAAVDATAGEV